MKQTLNQLLVELDGFKESGKNKAASSEALLIYSDRGNYCHCRYQLPGVARQVRGISVVFRCNRANHYLLSALVRPGRFDKKVVVPLPDVKGRAQILAHHMRDILSDVGTQQIFSSYDAPLISPFSRRSGYSCTGDDRLLWRRPTESCKPSTCPFGRVNFELTIRSGRDSCLS